MALKKSLAVAHCFAITIILIVTRGFLSITSITEEFAHYRVFHRSPINIIIHFIGSPAVLWSFLLFFAHLKIPYLDNIIVHIPFTETHQFNYSSLTILIYALFYLYLDAFGGILFAPFLYFLYSTANNLKASDQAKTVNARKRGYANGKLEKFSSWTGR